MGFVAVGFPVVWDCFFCFLRHRGEKKHSLVPQREGRTAPLAICRLGVETSRPFPPGLRYQHVDLCFCRHGDFFWTNNQGPALCMNSRFPQSVQPALRQICMCGTTENVSNWKQTDRRTCNFYVFMTALNAYCMRKTLQLNRQTSIHQQGSLVSDEGLSLSGLKSSHPRVTLEPIVGHPVGLLVTVRPGEVCVRHHVTYWDKSNLIYSLCTAAFNRMQSLCFTQSIRKRRTTQEQQAARKLALKLPSGEKNPQTVAREIAPIRRNPRRNPTVEGKPPPCEQAWCHAGWALWNVRMNMNWFPEGYGTVWH